MPSTDQPTAGAMRAAEAIHDALANRTTLPPHADIAAIIDRESGLGDIRKHLKAVDDWRLLLIGEHKLGRDRIMKRMTTSLKYALARVEGGGE